MKKIKQFLNIIKFLSGSTKPITGPFKVQWELTYACNLRCKHCHLWEVAGHVKNLPLEREKEIIYELAEAGVLNLSFSGGEMFLRKDVFELIKTAKNAGLFVSGNSNGWLIDENLAEKIGESGLNQLYISLDGFQNTHDEIRGVSGAFERAISAIKNLKKIIPSEKLSVFVNFVINHKNIKELTECAELVYDLGVDGFTVEPIHWVEKYSPEAELMLKIEDLDELKNEIKKFLKKFGKKLPHLEDYICHFETFVKDKESLKKYRCVASYGTLQIHPDGTVYPCPAAFYKIGDLKDNSFKKIWFGESAEICRKLIKEGHHPACWFTCVAPLNLFLSYFHFKNFHKVFNLRFLNYLRKKAK